MAPSEGWLFPTSCALRQPRQSRTAPTNVWARQHVRRAAGSGVLTARQRTRRAWGRLGFRGQIHVIESLALRPF